MKNWMMTQKALTPITLALKTASWLRRILFILPPLSISAGYFTPYPPRFLVINNGEYLRGLHS